MVIGILQVEIVVDGAESLKDKRRVVSSLKDKLHREHQVSVAEVDLQDSRERAVLGIVMAGSDARYTQSAIDRIREKITHGRGYYVADSNTQMIQGG